MTDAGLRPAHEVVAVDERPDNPVGHLPFIAGGILEVARPRFRIIKAVVGRCIVVFALPPLPVVLVLRQGAPRNDKNSQKDNSENVQ